MKTKNVIWIIAILAILGLVWIFAIGDRNTTDEAPDGETPDRETGDVRLFEPQPGSAVASPLTVRGEARGNWFFEANLPIEIRDAEGNLLAQAGAQADGEWMTTDFVPFEGTLEFEEPEEGSRGEIIVRKDNPSGLPEHDDSRTFQIVFGEGSGVTQTLEVFFSKEGESTNDCSIVFSVEREVPDTQAVARAALNELLEGPTVEEEAQDYFTSIPNGVEIQSLRIENGTAYVDFSEELDKNVGGSCRVSAIWNQINSTLTQFSTVDDVVISINGRTEDILQP